MNRGIFKYLTPGWTQAVAVALAIGAAACSGGESSSKRGGSTSPSASSSPSSDAGSSSNAGATPSPVSIPTETRIVLAAPSQYVQVGSSFTVVAAGGTPPYSYSVTSGSGLIDGAGRFTATHPGNVEITARDSLGHTGSSTYTSYFGLSITPSSQQIAVNNTLQFGQTGGVEPYVYTLVTGSGIVDPATGLYTAPATVGSAMVRVTDNLGNQSTATVTINPALTISPPSYSLAINNAVSLSAMGGVAPYLFSVTSGTGTVNSSTGVYTAPTSPGTATVRVTDSYGNTANSTLTIVPPVQISPTTLTLAANNTHTFTANGGVTPYLYSIQSGGGSINSSSGAFTAPATAGTVVVRVRDARGNASDATVTVNPPLQISPASVTLAVGNSQTFTATGGVGSYTFSIQSGLGTLNASSGAYVAPGAAGSATIRVTDSLGNTSDAVVTINPPLLISPSSITLAPNNTHLFSASGGVTPYSYSVTLGAGSVNSSSGLYTASSTSGTATLRVTDSRGNVSDASIVVMDPLSISPTSVQLAVGNSQTFTTLGGVAPISFAVVSGGGTINAASGAYTAPASSGTAVIRATDSLGNTADATVTINPALTISPTSYTLAVNNSVTFSATGGVTPYSYSVTSGPGSVSLAAGVYTASAASGTATVRVTDSLGNTSDATVTVNPALVISPASVTLVQSASQTFSSSGGVPPVAFSVVSGGGSINASSGAFTAPASSGSVIVRATDSLGNTSDSAVTIAAPLSISPATLTLAVNNSHTFSSTGGVAPVAFSVVSGGGSINASSGAFTAPASSGAVVVRATDSLGQISDALVTVNPALAISPSTLSLAVNNSHTFSSTGGVAPIAFSVISGGGSVNASSGAFTAPASSGSVVVRASDSLGNTSDATVTVNPALAISPTTLTLAVNNTHTFSSTGGVAPITFSVVSGGGFVNASSGAFTAPASSGSVVLRATDSLGNTSDATVTVNPALAISPTAYTLAVNNTVTFSAIGGVSPYSYSVVAGTGTVSLSTGVYTAPASNGSATVRVTDSLGNTSDATVTVNPALAISPSTLSLAVNNSHTFSSTGGVAPIAFSVISGGGSINASSGAFTAPASNGSVVVRATDSLGNTSDATVTVNPALGISPTAYTLAVNNTQTFSASGGVSPYAFSVFSGGGSINSSSGLFTAPASSGSTTVRVTDSLGNTSDATVTVNPALAISPTTLTLAVNNSHTFSSTGGVAPIAFSVVSGGGSVNASSGAFTAPASSGSVVVRATDSLGNTSDATVTVNPALAISPTTLTLAVNNSHTFSSTGGVAPIAFSVVSGGGSINASSGAFTAPASSGSVIVRATDSLGNTSDATVTVNAPLSISPSSKTLAVNNTQTFSASGGVSPYTFSVFSGGGSINSSSGLFTAPASSGSTTVRITDSLGNTSDATVTVNPALAISPTSKILAVNTSQTFSATGGVAPYTFSLAAGAGTLNSSSGAYTAPVSSGSATVRVTDSLGNTSDATVTVNPALTISPTSKILAVNNSFTFTASDGVGPYTYSVLSGGGSVNSSSGAYTAAASSGTATVRVTDAQGTTADASVTINPALSISPTSYALAVNNTHTFSATGGVGPYVFSLSAGPGSVNSSSGLYTAPASSGTASVLVTDSLGNTASANITINPALAISPSSHTLAANNTHTFTATGGVTPYSYSVLTGGGTINSSSGLYTAPASAGSATVRVTDARGNTSDSTVTINAALAISPTSKTLAVNNTHTFSATGGVSPYTFSVFSGTGSINSSSGLYTAPATSGSTTVRVTDSLGNTANSTVTINPALNISPSSAGVMIGMTRSFTATGGVGPYSYSVTLGAGSVNSSSGLYTAPATSGSATVRVTDTLGNTSDASVTIYPQITIAPLLAKAVTGATTTFTATGGDGVYSFSVELGTGSIDSITGDFTGPGTVDTSTVRVTDGLGNFVETTIDTYEPLTLSPTTVTLAPGNAQTFVGSGGYGALTYSVFAGTGSIDSGSGLYTAPGTNGTATVRVTDSLGNTADAAVTINNALAITPTSKTMTVHRTFTFTRTGGVGPFTWDVISGVGTIDANTGLYSAGTAIGTAVIEVSDSLGNTAQSNVTVLKPVEITSGQNHSCARFNDGSVKCWGSNATGQLGLGNTNSRGDAANEMGDNLPFVNLGTGRTAKQISAGSNFTCAVLDNDLLKCWGGNTNGVLGTGNTTSLGNAANQMGDALPYVNLGTGRTVKKVRAGRLHACAILDNDALKCWGYNLYGSLGIGSTAHMGDNAGEMGDSLPAVNLGTGRYAIDMGGGLVHTCVLLDNASVKCFGRSNRGQLGYGNTTSLGTSTAQMGDTLAAVSLGTGRTVTQLSVGYEHNCAILDNGAYKCWGRTANGQLGKGSTTANLGDAAGEMGDALTNVSLGTGRTASASTSSHANYNCILRDNGTLVCFGANARGQLGIGNVLTIGDSLAEMGDALVAANMGTGLGIVQIATGNQHMCALLDNDQVKCWGNAANGQQGNGSTTLHLGDGANEMGDNLTHIKFSGP